MDRLPSEVVSKILEYLSHEDRRLMALVSTAWHHASLHPTFLNKEMLVFREPQYGASKFCDYLLTLMTTRRQLLRLCIQYGPEPYCLEQTLGLFNVVGERIIFLNLIGLYRQSIKDSFVDSITEHCKNLHTLVLNDVCCLSITDNPCRTQLLKLKSLTLGHVNISDRNFNKLMKCFPNINCIDIERCGIAGVMLPWHRAINRFYPDYRNRFVDYDSDDLFTTVNFIRYLSTASNIKTLRLEENSHIFPQLPDNLKLHELQVSCYDLVIDLHKYVEALSKQTALQRLDIVVCSCCMLLSPLTKLSDLKHLSIRCLRHFRHPPCRDNEATILIQQLVSSLKRMPNIRSFALYGFPFTDTCPVEMFNIPDSMLKYLTTLSCPIIDIYKLYNVGVNLTNLEIPNGEIFTASDLKLLFTKFINLRSLVIRKCFQLNDDVLMESPITNLKGLTYLGIYGAKLTYHCFQYIKLTDLKCLLINNLSLKPCIDKNDIADFEKSLKELSSFVPALTLLNISIQELESRDFLKSLHSENNVPYLEALSLNIKSFFKKLNECCIDTSFMQYNMY